MNRRTRASRWTNGFLCLLIAGACSMPAPGEGSAAAGPPVPVGSTTPGTSSGPVESVAPDATASAPDGSLRIDEPDDPAQVLTGRAVEALGAGGIDLVMRIGAPGFRLPEGERLYDLDGDHVLAVVADPEGATARMVVRDLNGGLLRAFDAGMQVPQVGIIRGDDVYFGGIDYEELGNPDTAMDRGAWAAHGDAPPRVLISPANGVAIYQTFQRSPDGRTVGISHCGEEACVTTLMRQGSAPVQIPKPGLIALTNEVALLIGRFSDVTAHAISDGAELWRAETEGAYLYRYPTTDGARIVMSSIEDAGDNDGNTTDQLRLEVLDALTGTVERTVLVSTEERLLTVQPTLSSDRYVALFDGVIPNADEGSNVVRIVDLDAGELLDVELAFGDVP